MTKTTTSRRYRRSAVAYARLAAKASKNGQARDYDYYRRLSDKLHCHADAEEARAAGQVGA